jgi:hypothetical protein
VPPCSHGGLNSELDPARQLRGRESTAIGRRVGGTMSRTLWPPVMRVRGNGPTNRALEEASVSLEPECCIRALGISTGPEPKARPSPGETTHGLSGSEGASERRRVRAWNGIPAA